MLSILPASPVDLHPTLAGAVNGTAGNECCVLLLVHVGVRVAASPGASITRRRPSVQRASQPWGVCFQSAACRSWGRAFGICTQYRRWSTQPGRPSSGRRRCVPAASSPRRSSPASSVAIAASGVLGPFLLPGVYLGAHDWNR